MCGKRVRGVQGSKSRIGRWSEGGSWDSTGRTDLGFQGSAIRFLLRNLDSGDVGVDLEGLIGAFGTVTTRGKHLGRKTGLVDVSETTGRVSVGSRATSMTSGIRVKHIGLSTIEKDQGSRDERVEQGALMEDLGLREELEG